MTDKETQDSISAALLARWRDQSKMVEQIDQRIADVEEQLTRLKEQKTFLERDVEHLRRGWVGANEASSALYLVELIDKRR